LIEIDILTKIEILTKNQNSEIIDKNSRFPAKIEILAKDRNLVKTGDFGQNKNKNCLSKI